MLQVGVSEFPSLQELPVMWLLYVAVPVSCCIHQGLSQIYMLAGHLCTALLMGGGGGAVESYYCLYGTPGPNGHGTVFVCKALFCVLFMR